MDRELADDLTEVLISALIGKSKRAYRIIGKESFRKKLTDRKSKGGDVCLNSHDCVRSAAREMGLSLLVLGKVGKAAGGYRLEVRKLSVSGGTEPKPFRKRVAGDVGKLIEEVEGISDWVFAAAEAWLAVEVTPADAALKVDGKTMKYAGKPLSVTPGTHKVEASRKGYRTASAKVTCKPGETCTARLKLAKQGSKPPPDDGIKPPPDDGRKADTKGRISTRTIVISSALGALALGAGGGSFYMFGKMGDAQDKADKLISDSCPKNVCTLSENAFYDKLDPIVADGESSALWANVLGGVAAASAVAAVTVLVVDLASGPPAKVEKATFVPQIGPGYSGLALKLSF